MHIALTYGHLNDIDLFAWSPLMAVMHMRWHFHSNKAIKITPLIKQRLFGDKLGLFLLGLDGPPLNIRWAPHQNLKTKALYLGNYIFAFESNVLWISRTVHYFYRLFEWGVYLGHHLWCCVVSLLFMLLFLFSPAYFQAGGGGHCGGPNLGRG